MTQESKVKPTLILGVGNKLLKDEGVGVHFVETLKLCQFPSDVEVDDGGARGIDLLTLFRGRKLVIVVDCARMGEAPGTVRTFEKEEIIREHTGGFSVHGTSLANTLKLGEHLGILPDVVVVGIEPETVEIEIGLSDTVAGALEEVQRVVEEIIRERGPG
ncbi:MAG: hydrogenase maturation protease [Candidatus Eiseniibacteriota bacterium]|nr:MAG: hydrogenase maturation protease [Candidatus Eisenbacteria bacterium]